MLNRAATATPGSGARGAAGPRRWIEGWGALPREPRDTLFLLAVIAWVLLPHLPRLPWWCAGLTVVVLLWRGVLALQSRPLPGKWWLVGLLAVTIAATFLTHRTLLGRDAGVTLIVVLLALKTLELRARRDAFVVFFLGFFAMLTNFFFSQSLLTAAGMLLALLGLLTALVNAHMPAGRPSLLVAARTAGWMALLGAPIMAVLFVLFPRIAPLWGIPSDAMSGRSGLSSSMQVGTIARLALDESVAMRVRWQGQPPPPTELYFRGPVLATFDGREWRPLRSMFQGRALPTIDLRTEGAPYRYEVTLEPHNRPWIYTLDAARNRPELGGAEVLMLPELQWVTTRPVVDIVRYAATSHIDYSYGPRSRTVELLDHVELPPGFNPRTMALAAQMRRDPRLAQAGSAELVREVMDRLANGGYVYTLEPGVFGEHTADEFWFDRKQGFCEHIASSFVVLMRALDVPARVVTGYQGGERNPVDGFWTLRQSDAHAWAEVWYEGQGWVRVDPTAAVAPARVAAFERLRAPQGVLAGAISNMNPNLVARLRAGWEAMNNAWNQWVLNYTQSKQLNLLKDLGFESPSWTHLSYLLLGLVVLASALGALWTLWERVRQDPWLHLLGRARKRVAALGLPTHAASAPRQMASDLRARFGDAGAPAADWLLRLEAHRYAPQATHAQALRKLRDEFGQLPWPAAEPGAGASAPAAGAAAAALWVTVPVALAAALWPADGLAQGQAVLARPVLAQPVPAALVVPVADTPATRQTAQRATQRAHPRAKPREHQRAQQRPAGRTPVQGSAPYAGRVDAMQFADDLAERRDLDRQWVRQAIGSAHRLPSVIRLMTPAPVGTAKNWQAYRSRFVEPVRIRAGMRFWQDNAAWLEQAESQYGVPAAIIVGILGVETIYGRQQGNFRVIDALSTLAFDFPREHRRAAERTEYFRRELEQYLSLKNRSAEDPMQMLGSYAGAMGIAQFMPSSWVRHAVDFDGDGRIDLAGSAADAIGSVANYFRAHGWTPGMPTHFSLRLEPGPTREQLADLLAADILPSHSPASMLARGVTLEEAGQRHAGLLALVELQNGADAPTYVAGTENFYAITRYNWSSYYAMAVIDLGQAVQSALGAQRAAGAAN